MADMLRSSPLVAIDTNFLFDLADKNDVCWDCLTALSQHKSKPQILACPTALQELIHLAENGQDVEEMELAQIALESMLEWGIKPLNLVPVENGIVERIADEIRRRNLLPQQERNDSFIVAEAAKANCSLLVSSDRMITGIENSELSRLLEDFHVTPIAILWPKKVAKMFGR